ncbi:CatA-like O-acetyltransferase [Deinococcus marmoris]|uniref:CatA-like O-acetyltransferase n=1 Tax=Deinococcus marmoris TaxID=249408 RepID=UPI000691C9DD|nr:CatA-like O-acetyltransferase [Deinococcus marmoris]
MLRPLDLTVWPRRQIYQHFRQNPCTFNVTVSVDVTAFKSSLKEAGLPFVPALIYCICAVVNRLPALRMGLIEGEQPGVWDSVLPLYTVFHPETETFSALWTKSFQSCATLRLKQPPTVVNQEKVRSGRTYGVLGPPDAVQHAM